jgi:hypothetical protein
MAMMRLLSATKPLVRWARRLSGMTGWTTQLSTATKAPRLRPLAIRRP